MLQTDEAKKYLKEYDELIERITNVLSELGYPKNYYSKLYADWIHYIMDDIKLVEKREDIANLKYYLHEMKDKFSSYYHYMVREDMWMGLRTFHSDIESLIDSIDYENANQELVADVYENIDCSIDYADNAFLLATYLLGKKEHKGIEKIKQPIRIRKIASGL